MIIVTIEIPPWPTHDVIGSNDNRGPSQPDERTKNVLDATQAFETMVSHLVEALVNIQGEGTPNGSKGWSFKDFMSIIFPMFKGNLNSGEAREWLTNLEELLRVMDYTKEQRVKYVAYKFSEEARRWWYAERNLLEMELGSKEAITWTWFKEEFYWEYACTPQELRFNKKQSYWCHRCGGLHFEKCRSRKNLCYRYSKVRHFIWNCNWAKRNGIGLPGRK